MVRARRKVVRLRFFPTAEIGAVTGDSIPCVFCTKNQTILILAADSCGCQLHMSIICLNSGGNFDCHFVSRWKGKNQRMEIKFGEMRTMHVYCAGCTIQ